jgi:hypothetical protein
MQPRKATAKANGKSKDANAQAQNLEVTARFKFQMCEQCLFWLQKRKPSDQKVTGRFK